MFFIYILYNYFPYHQNNHVKYKSFILNSVLDKCFLDKTFIIYIIIIKYWILYY